MAIDIIDGAPIGNAKIGQGVVAGEMELAHKDFPIGSEAFLHKQRGEPRNKQAVECHYHQQDDECHPALFLTNLENVVEYTYHTKFLFCCLRNHTLIHTRRR